jgi:hypothetical protein
LFIQTIVDIPEGAELCFAYGDQYWEECGLVEVERLLNGWWARDGGAGGGFPARPPADQVEDSESEYDEKDEDDEDDDEDDTEEEDEAEEKPKRRVAGKKARKLKEKKSVSALATVLQAGDDGGEETEARSVA